jgi:Holliday junction resolvase RusA-like endonuclease
LPGSIRSKKNSKRIFARGRKVICLPSESYEVWESAVHAYAKAQLPAIFPIKDKVHVSASIYYKGPRPDLSGALESLGDSLEGIVWVNDRQIESWDGSKLIHDKGDPRVEITVTNFTEGGHDLHDR